MNIKQPGSHLDHMLRQTRMHHVQLSSMADIKANMLLTLASVLVTLAAPHVSRPDLRFPLMVLIAFCLLTIILAVYAVMPKVPVRIDAKAAVDPSAPRFNILFFGDFVRMPYEQFATGMEAVMNDPSKAYEAQVKEIYTLGTFLARKKYRFLRLAYLAFLAGLTASALTLFLTTVE